MRSSCATGNSGPPLEFLFPEKSGVRSLVSLYRALRAERDFEKYYPYLANLGPHLSTRDEGLLERLFYFLSKMFVSGRHRADRDPWWPDGGRSAGADVLMIGERMRPLERSLYERECRRLLDAGATVEFWDCFSPSATGVPIWNWARSFIKSGQLRVADPFREVGGTAGVLIAASREAGAVVASLGQHTGRQARLELRAARGYINIARSRIIAEKVIRGREYGALIVRNHFNPLSAYCARICLRRGTPVIGFQHGVISHDCPFSPLLASTYICFGEQSQEVISRLNAPDGQLSDTSGGCEWIVGGSFIDPVTPIPGHAEQRSILIADQGVGYAPAFFGIEDGLVALQEIAEALALRCPNVRSVVVRAHPQTTNLSAWERLKERHPGRIELSPPGATLESDLNRSCLVIGLFSGMLPSAAKAGLPVVFVYEPGWYYTPDLGCFYEHSFRNRRETVELAIAIAESSSAREEYRMATLNAANRYYAEGRQGSVVPERCLASRPTK